MILVVVVVLVVKVAHNGSYFVNIQWLELNALAKLSISVDYIVTFQCGGVVNTPSCKPVTLSSAPSLGT